MSTEEPKKRRARAPKKAGRPKIYEEASPEKLPRCEKCHSTSVKLAWSRYNHRKELLRYRECADCGHKQYSVVI